MKTLTIDDFGSDEWKDGLEKAINGLPEIDPRALQLFLLNLTAGVVASVAEQYDDKEKKAEQFMQANDVTLRTLVYEMMGDDAKAFAGACKITELARRS